MPREATHRATRELPQADEARSRILSAAEEVFAEVASSTEPFKGMTYRKLGNKGLALAETRMPAATPSVSPSH